MLAHGMPHLHRGIGGFAKNQPELLCGDPDEDGTEREPIPSPSEAAQRDNVQFA
jgi:hypothetical protein